MTDLAINPNTELFTLADQWKEAKRNEDNANKLRVQIEQQMIAAASFTKLEGSQTLKNDALKVTFTAKLMKKLDVKKWLDIKPRLPEAFQRVVKETSTIDYKLDQKGLDYLRDNAPEILAQVAEAITVAPTKTAVKVERL
ncbi:MAG: hypothetical protein K9L25_13735 [Methylovulum sp.]|nr:hypothetical protein [Methylovulum sp.]